MRSCVGCGARAPQQELVRMTWRDGALRIDGGRRATGRGGYLHRRAACCQKFVERRGPVRSLRAAVPRTAREALAREVGSGVREGEE